MMDAAIMKAENSREDTLPWYRQFWPWFIISLPATAVVAGIATVIIAVKNDDSLVVDNYYKEGLAINRVLTQQDVARQLGVSAVLDYNADSHQLFVQLPEGIAQKYNVIKLRLVHSTQANKDKILLLNKGHQSNFVLQVDAIQDGWWNLFIEPVDGEWQISQRIHFPMHAKQLVQPGP